MSVRVGIKTNLDLLHLLLDNVWCVLHALQAHSTCSYSSVGLHQLTVLLYPPSAGG